MATSNLKEFFKVISKNLELGEDFDFDQIPEVELPEKFNENFHNSFLTPLAAKNNPEVRSHFKGQYLNDVDKKTRISFLENGGTEAQFDELKAEEPDSMKLISLALTKVVELKENTNATSGDKAHEAYKTTTAKQIKELLEGKAKFEDSLKDAVGANDAKWASRLQNATLKNKLNAKEFNGSIKREDAVLLTMNKVDNSPFLLKLDENLNQKVYDKANPENLALKDGVEMTWDDVLDDSSYEYTKKNEVPPTPPQPVVVDAQVSKTTSDEEGKWTPGHPNYAE